MLPKTKIIFISVIIIFFLAIIGGSFLLGFFSERSEIKKEFILRKELKKNPSLGTIDPENPYYSPPLEEKEIPQGAIRLKVSQQGFQPAQFKVKTGQLVVLTLTSIDNNFHSLFFEDKMLKQISIMTEGKITRGIVFYAPEKPGKYKFFDNENQGKEKKEGIMFVE